MRKILGPANGCIHVKHLRFIQVADSLSSVQVEVIRGPPTQIARVQYCSGMVCANLHVPALRTTQQLFEH